MRFVTETRQKGAIPVLFSSIVRRNFNENGTLVDTHGEYPMETRLVAEALDVPFIDLQYLTEQLEESYGVEGSRKLHLHFEPGETPYYPDGKHDDTHLSKLGANNVAKLAVEELKKKVPGLLKFIKE
jgi:lysophospholipase L1-like esterase